MSPRATSEPERRLAALDTQLRRLRTVLTTLRQAWDVADVADGHDPAFATLATHIRDTRAAIIKLRATRSLLYATVNQRYAAAITRRVQANPRGPRVRATTMEN